MSVKKGKESILNSTKMFVIAAITVLIIIICAVSVVSDDSSGTDVVNIYELLESRDPLEFSIDENVTLTQDVVISSQIEVDGGGFITINPGVNVEVADTGSLIINGVSIINNGSFENIGTIITNVIVDVGTGSINNNGYFYNDGTILNHGSIINGTKGGLVNKSCTIVNYNTIVNDGTITNYDTIINHDTITNDVVNEESGIITNNGNITNNGVLVNAGTENKFSGTGTLYNYNVMSGSFGCSVFNYGNKMDLLPIIITPPVNEVVCEVQSDVSAVQLTPSSGSFESTIVKLDIGNMSAIIPEGGLTEDVPVTVVMAKSNTTRSNVGGTVYDVSFTGLKSDTVVRVTLPTFGTICEVHHLVDGASIEKMRVVGSTMSSVTFVTDHNSSYAVVPIYDAAISNNDAGDVNTAFMLSIFAVVVSLVLVTVIIQRR